MGLESDQATPGLYVLDKWPVTSKDVDAFLDRYFSKKFSMYDNVKGRVSVELKAAEQEKNLLKDTKRIDFIDFHGLMQDPSIDTLVYFYNSSVSNEEQKNRSRTFNHVAKFARNSLKFATLAFASYDVGRVRVHEAFAGDRGFAVGEVFLVAGGVPAKRFPRFKSPKAGIHPESLLKFAFLNAHHKLRLNPNQEIMFTEEDEEFFADKSELFESQDSLDREGLAHKAEDEADDNTSPEAGTRPEPTGDDRIEL